MNQTDNMAALARRLSGRQQRRLSAGEHRAVTGKLEARGRLVRSPAQRNIVAVLVKSGRLRRTA
jgi:hypothetical protein